MAGYLSVSSNDDISHQALHGSPETLCGKLVVNVLRPGQIADLSTYDTQALECDICATLAGGSMVKETDDRPYSVMSSRVEAGRDCPHCEDGLDPTGNFCWNCGGSGWLDEGDEDWYTDLNDLKGINTDDLHGVKVAVETTSWEEDALPEWACKTCRGAGVKDGRPCPTCSGSSGPYDQAAPTTAEVERLRNASAPRYDPKLTPAANRVVGNAPPLYDRLTIRPLDPINQDPPLPPKEATNYTRDGVAIENGFDVQVTREQASRTPFLDLTRVSVSDKQDCPDCETSQWLSKIASCDQCGKMKCSDCMEEVGPSLFFGMCKKCASADSDLTYEADYEEPTPDPSRFLTYLLNEPDPEIDELFLPNGDFE